MGEEYDYYEVLGLKKEDKPTQDQIRRAFKKSARKYHPDINPDADPQAMNRVNEAYECLKDQEKRDIYDQYGKEGLEKGGNPGAGGFPFGGGFFNDIFGGPRQRGPPRGETVKQGLRVTLEDLYQGALRRIRVTRTRICKTCKGKGADDPSKVKKCDKCDGHGFVMAYQQLGPGFVTQTRRPCPKCKGAGEMIDPKFVCKGCSGKKVVSEKKTLEIHIEKGMHEGQKIVFEGEADERPGVKPGDIIFYLQQAPHKTFTRDGAHLKMKKKISLASALTGCKFTIGHLDGRELLVSNPVGEVIRPGQVKMIEGEGMPLPRNPMEKGNLFIEFEIEFPKRIPDSISQKLIALLPPKAKVSTTSSEVEEVDLKEPDFSKHSNRRGGQGGNIYDQDEDHEMGGEGISCANS